MRTNCPSVTGISTISPETSGDILTSISGWIFPVAVTICVTVFRIAFSVVIGIGFSRFFEAMAVPMAITRISGMPMINASFFFERL